MRNIEVIEDAFRPEMFKKSLVAKAEDFDLFPKGRMSNSSKILLALIALSLFVMALPRLIEYMESKSYFKPKEDEESSPQGH